MLKNYLHRKGNPRGLHNIEDEVIVEYMARGAPGSMQPWIIIR